MTSAPDVPLDLQTATGGGPSAVAVLPIIVDVGLLDSDWLFGPLPVAQPQNDSTRLSGHHTPTDEPTRRTLVDDHQADVLYGSSFLERRHRKTNDEFIAALELLCEPTITADGFGLLALHVTPRGWEMEDLLHWQSQSAYRRGTAHMLDAALRHCGPGIRPSETGAPKFLSFIKIPQATDDEKLRHIAAYALVSRSSASNWQSLGTRAAGHPLTIDKPDWSAMVLRDGAAYVSHDRSAEPYGESLRMLVHSVHLDALMFALIQRTLLDRSGRRSVVVPLDKPQELIDLESGHYEFRRTYWRTALTRKRTAPPDVVLHAFQDELLTAADVLDVEQRVGDGARLALSLHARQQQQDQARQAYAQAKLNRIVQNGSVVIGSFALAFTAAPVIAEPSLRAFFIALLCGAFSVLVTFALLSATGRREGAR